MAWRGSAVLLVGMAATAALAGCADDDGLVGRHIDSGQFSGHDFPTLTGTAIITASSWRGFWEEHKPDTAVPDVDFDDEFVVAMFLGEQQEEGYAILITQVEYDAATQEYTVTYRAGEPGDDCVVPQRVTQPFHIVAVSRVGEGEPVVVTQLDEAFTTECG